MTSLILTRPNSNNGLEYDKMSKFNNASPLRVPSRFGRVIGRYIQNTLTPKSVNE